MRDGELGCGKKRCGSRGSGGSMVWKIREGRSRGSSGNQRNGGVQVGEIRREIKKGEVGKTRRKEEGDVRGGEVEEVRGKERMGSMEN